MHRSRTYNVYVIELSRDVLQHARFVEANLHLRAGKPCVYVGSTYLSPEERFQQHLDGHKANGYARRYGIRLRPALYRGLQGFETREQAERAEEALAKRLRSRGYAVWFGV